MKVLHVIESLGRGGAEQLLVSMLPELKRQGVDGLVAVRGGAMDLEGELLSAGIRVVRLESRHRWDVLGASKDLAALSRAEKADIVHAHLYFPTLAAALMRFRRMSSSRTCTTFHNLAYSGANPKTLKLEVRRRLSAWLCSKGISKFIAVSRSVADHYRGALKLSSVIVVPNAVNLSALLRFDPQTSGSKAIGSDCKIILPGRIVREKGHADLVDALVLLKARGFAPDVTFAGDGPLRLDMEDKVRSLGLENRVRFAGSLPHPEMLKLIAAADVVVVPSRFEGFGIAALEAMALGRAVVATHAGGLPETVGQAGVLVNVRDPLGLADAIEHLLVNPDRRSRLGEEARVRSREFDLPRVTSRLISVYSDMLSADSNRVRA